MNAYITKGKFAGKICEVSQWCNNWFTLNSENPEIACKPFSPSSLAFTPTDIEKIIRHKNNGTLFMEYEIKETKPVMREFIFTFRKIKYERQQNNRTCQMDNLKSRVCIDL